METHLTSIVEIARVERMLQDRGARDQAWETQQALAFPVTFYLGPLNTFPWCLIQVESGRNNI